MTHTDTSSLEATREARIHELGKAPVGKLLFKYSLPAVVGTVVTSIYHLIDSIVIGHAIDDPNVIAGIAVTFPIMTLSGAFGMLIGAGCATRISIVLGQRDLPRAEMILGNSVLLTLIIGFFYSAGLLIFLDPILKIFGASEASLPFAREFLQWLIPGMVLINLTFSYNNVMRATGYPRKAMLTNLLGAGLNVILAPLFLFVFRFGIWGAALATDISMFITAFFVLQHFFVPSHALTFRRGTYRLNRRIVWSVISIGMAPFCINFAAAAVNAIVNNSLYFYGGDNAIAAVVVFNRFVTVFVFIVIGITQGMQPILGYNYGSRHYDRLFRTLFYAISAGLIVTIVGATCAQLFPRQIASLFMQDSTQIDVAVSCLKKVTLVFFFVGFQIVATNFFQSLGMSLKAIFLSLTRQIIFMIPTLLILPQWLRLDGVWYTYPVADFLSVIVTAILLLTQIRRIKGQARLEACRH